MIPIFEVLLLSAQSLSEIRDKSYHSSVMFQNLLQKVLPSMFGGHCFGMVRSTIVLILAILSMQALASPLNLEVSIKGVQNGNTVERSAGVQISNASLTLPNNKTLIDWKCDEDNTPDQSCIKKYLECGICEGICSSFCK